MIEIGHKQAMRMLRISLDRILPEEQWAALQSHLEHCPNCRGYADQMDRLEKDTRRVLRGRWEGIQGITAVVIPTIIEKRQARDQFIRRLMWVGFVILLVSAVVALGGFEQLLPGSGSFDTAPAIVAQENVESMPTLAPTAQPGDFDKVIVFASNKDGDSDLYLLNSGGRPENLTGAEPDPGIDDTDPSWSPDGEWIAYLSNRTGKPEVFVMGLVRNQPVQLTNDPGIEWHGPLSWSADGQHISLSGIRKDQGNQAWVYVVPLDGAGSWSLAGTRGGWSPEFSPTGNRLAYLINNNANLVINVFSFGRGDSAGVTGLTQYWSEPAQQTMNDLPQWFQNQIEWQPEKELSLFNGGSGLDWSADGKGLVYIDQGLEDNRSGAGIIVEREIAFGTNRSEAYPPSAIITQSRWSLAYRAATWALDDSIVYLENLDDARASLEPARSDPCWTLRRQPLASTEVQRKIYVAGGLCVESGLDRTAWTPDGDWLVVVGSLRGTRDRSLYAIRMSREGGDGDDESGTLLRLVGDEWQPGQPCVRPSGRMLGIKPRPVWAGMASIPVVDVSSASGQILYSIKNNAAGVIVSASPDGTGGRVLTSSQGENRCPAWSPDGQRVAFLSDRENGGQGGGSDVETPDRQEIYVVSATGEIEQVSHVGLIPETGQAGDGYGAAARYGCPVWSPDGRYLAATVDSGRDFYLAVLPSADIHLQGVPSRFIRIGRSASQPTWMPDSRQVILTHVVAAGRSPEILLVNLSGFLSGPLSSEKVTIPFELDAVENLVVSADGEYVYILAARINREQERTAMLRRVSLKKVMGRYPLSQSVEFDIRGASPGGLYQTDGSSLGLVVINDPGGRYKSLIQRYNPSRRTLETVLAFEDMINSAAWSDNGQWVIFSAESGLWLLDAQSARRTRTRPVWVSPQPVADLDWH